MFEDVRADSVQQVGYSAVVTILLAIGLIYLISGCSRDWVVLGGLLIDGIGALLLAAPDLGYFKQHSYAGKLQQAYNSEFIDPSAHHISPNMDWYSVFLEEMDEAFGGEDVSDSSEFYIEEVVDNYVLFHRAQPGDDAKPMSVSVAGRNMRRAIADEERQIRRVGAVLLVGGFGLQILGYVFDGAPFGFIC